MPYRRYKGSYNIRIRPITGNLRDLSDQEMTSLIKRRHKEMALVASNFSKKLGRRISVNIMLNLLVENAAKKLKS